MTIVGGKSETIRDSGGLESFKYEGAERYELKVPKGGNLIITSSESGIHFKAE